MTLRQAFAGMLQFFSVLFFLALGGLLVGLFFIPEISFYLSNAILMRPNILLIAGFGLIGFSLLLSTALFSVNRGRVLFLRMGTSVDVKVIHQMIAPILQKQFSARVALSNVQILRGKELNLGLKFVPMSEEDREKLLMEAERHLQTLLIERFGYSQPFVVQATL